MADNPLPRVLRSEHLELPLRLLRELQLALLEEPPAALRRRLRAQHGVARTVKVQEVHALAAEGDKEGAGFATGAGQGVLREK